MTLADEAVTPADVARRAGLTVDEVRTEAEALGLYVAKNWAPEPAVTAGGLPAGGRFRPS